MVHRPPPPPPPITSANPSREANANPSTSAVTPTVTSYMCVATSDGGVTWVPHIGPYVPAGAPPGLMHAQSEGRGGRGGGGWASGMRGRRGGGHRRGREDDPGDAYRGVSTTGDGFNAAKRARAGVGDEGKASGTNKPSGTSKPTLPTAEEIPVVKPVDVASLPEDVRRYREERAKHWPSDSHVQAKLEAGEDEERARALRKERLREILAKQREMGHFEASQEIGEEGDGERTAAMTTKREQRVGEQEKKPSGDSVKVCRFWLQGGCRKGDACDFKHEAGPNSDQRCRFFARGRCKAGKRCPFRHDIVDKKTSGVSSGNPQTLLKKLLHKEIKRDEERLLQLFRFLVNNDFFEGSKGCDEPYWMFPWADEDFKVVDRRTAIASLPPIKDEDAEVKEPVTQAMSEEVEKVPRPDMGFFAAYDSEEDSRANDSD